MLIDPLQTAVMPRLRAPIVLVHGITGFSRIRIGRFVLIHNFHRIHRAMEAAGNRVFAPWLMYAGPVAQRAVQLRTFIDRHCPGERVHLICQSMGGLDARYLITRLGMADRVLSLTTLGTPHRGSSVADWGQHRLRRLVLPLFDFAGLSAGGFEDLTTWKCRQFNLDTPDVPGVRYFSVAAYLPPGHILRRVIPLRHLEAAEGPCDGLVSVASARWGEDCELWEGTHFSLLNWGNRLPGLPPFLPDAVPGYARLLQRLVREGF
jgi:triacylglycerol lipase